MRSAWIVVVAFVALAACSSKPPVDLPPGNTAPPGGELTIDLAQPMGTLAMALVPIDSDQRETMRWSMPHGTTGGAIAPTPAELGTPGQRVIAVPRTGPSVELVVGAQTKVPYGCDGVPLDVVPLTGPQLPAGIAWLVPPDHPAAWAPASVPVTAGQATAMLATWTAGPLAITSTRIDAMHAALRIAIDGRDVLTVPGEKAMMDGAEPGPIDLREVTPGVAEVEAVYAIAPAGPWLVVLLVPGYEGSSFVAHLIGRATSRPLEGLDRYVYACAF